MVSLVKNFSLRYGHTKLYFGIGTIDKLAKYVKSYNNIAIVTGKRSAKLSGALNDLLKILSDYNISYKIYDIVTPNPWASQADELAKLFIEEKHDAVVAIGGGSVIDAAKVASVIALSGGKAVDYLYRRIKPNKMLPLYAINLTHGTGTEIDRYAVLTVNENKEKRGISIRYNDISIDDPKYTLTLPKNQALYTTLDSFYHSYEAITSIDSMPFSDQLSMHAISLINKWLEKALDRPRDIEARYWLLYASMIAGMAIDMSSTHVIHALEHVLSSLNPKLPHGCGLAIIGPQLIKYIHKAVPEASAYALRIIDPSIKPLSEYSSYASRAVIKFQERHGFDKKLSDYGFSRRDIDDIVKMLFNGLRYLAESTPFNIREDIIREVIVECL